VHIITVILYISIGDILPIRACINEIILE